MTECTVFARARARTLTTRLGTPLVVLTLLAPSASARADEPPAAAPAAEKANEPVATPSSSRTLPIDATKPGAVVEVLQSSEENFRFDIPIFNYDKGTWAILCVAPCSAQFKRDAIYRVKGFNGITESAGFLVPPDAHAVHIAAGSILTSRIGRVLVLVGGLVAGTALPAALAADSTPNRNAGFIVTGGGGLTMLVGGLLWALSGTRVDLP